MMKEPALRYAEPQQLAVSIECDVKDAGLPL
jgi:hypothetical protein